MKAKLPLASVSRRRPVSVCVPSLNPEPPILTVHWPSSSAGFSLQQNTNNVATVNWSNLVTAPLDDGTTRTVIVNPPTCNRFFRLFKP